MADRFTQQEEEARANFVSWLEWALAVKGEKYPSKAALARAMGVTPPLLTQIMAKGSSQAPNLKTLLGARHAVEQEIDVMLLSHAPRLPGA